MSDGGTACNSAVHVGHHIAMSSMQPSHGKRCRHHTCQVSTLDSFAKFGSWALSTPPYSRGHLVRLDRHPSASHTGRVGDHHRTTNIRPSALQDGKELRIAACGRGTRRFSQIEASSILPARLRELAAFMLLGSEFPRFPVCQVSSINERNFRRRQADNTKAIK